MLLSSQICYVRAVNNFPQRENPVRAASIVDSLECCAPVSVDGRPSSQRACAIPSAAGFCPAKRKVAVVVDGGRRRGRWWCVRQRIEGASLHRIAYLSPHRAAHQINQPDKRWFWLPFFDCCGRLQAGWVSRDTDDCRGTHTTGAHHHHYHHHHQPPLLQPPPAADFLSINHLPQYPRSD